MTVSSVPLTSGAIRFGFELVQAFDERISTLGRDSRRDVQDGTQLLLDEYQQEIGVVLHELLCQRLLQNDRSLPLWSDEDIHTMMIGINSKHGAVDVFSVEQIARLWIVEYLLQSRALYLQVNAGSDLYDLHFHEITAALAVATLHPSLSPDELAADEVAFCEYIRRAMTIETWNRIIDLELEHAKSMTLKDMVGEQNFIRMVANTVAELESDEIPDFYSDLVKLDAEINVTFTHNAIVRDAELKRWREKIWPDVV